MGQDLAVREQIAAPDAAWFVAVQSTLDARNGHRAAGTDSLCLVDIADVVGEEQCGRGAGGVTAAGRLPLR